MNITNALALTLAAGLAPVAHAQQRSNRFVTADDIAPITLYYDMATGTLSQADPRAASPSGPLWLNNNIEPCLGWTYGVMDDPDADADGFSDFFNTPCDGSGTFPCEGSASVFWGDIAADTVVDRITIGYGSLVPDTGVPSCTPSAGVAGCDMYITLNDADNGFDDPNRKCITKIRIPTLPGAVLCIGGCYHTAWYTLVIDLAPSQVFEVGDSDAIDDAGTGLSGAAIYGSPTFADLDEDGLHDFSYTIRFDQSALPQSERGAIGFFATAPKLGSPGDLAPHPADARGLEDVQDIYWSSPNCPPNSSPYIGAFYFGGFVCDPDNLSDGRPFASAYLELHGPNPPIQCGPEDIAPPFGALDITDIITFLGAFALEQRWVNALAPPSNFTGSPDFNDVVAYLTSFAAGCP